MLLGYVDFWRHFFTNFSRLRVFLPNNDNGTNGFSYKNRSGLKKEISDSDLSSWIYVPSKWSRWSPKHFLGAFFWRAHRIPYCLSIIPWNRTIFFKQYAQTSTALLRPKILSGTHFWHLKLRSWPFPPSKLKFPLKNSKKCSQKRFRGPSKRLWWKLDPWWEVGITYFFV